MPAVSSGQHILYIRSERKNTWTLRRETAPLSADSLQITILTPTKSTMLLLIVTAYHLSDDNLPPPKKA